METVKKPNAWLVHIKKVREQNPGLDYRDAMTLASSTWNGKKK